MKVYTLKRVQTLPISIGEAWAFFSVPQNLGKITPPYMNFEIISQTGGLKAYTGQLIEYRVSVLPGIRLRWLTEITNVTEPTQFIDEQRKGPYKLWHHTHTFRETPNGVEMTDVVKYQLPAGPLGVLAHALFVERRLNGIFDYRFEVLNNLFSKK
ncbi:MAG: SRPBCC family protein [Bacteroidota bacterium]